MLQEALKGDILKWAFAVKFALHMSILTAVSRQFHGKRRLDRESAVQTATCAENYRLEMFWFKMSFRDAPKVDLP